jgi:hypothetical protein
MTADDRAECQHGRRAAADHVSAMFKHAYRFEHSLLAVQPFCSAAWEKQVLSARGFKRVGRHSEYAT